MSNIPTLVKGARHIAENLSLYEPLRVPHFEFQVVFEQGELLLPTAEPEEDDNEFIDPNLASDILRLTIENAPVPSYTTNSIQVWHGNVQTHFAGKPSYNSPLSMTVKEYIGRSSRQILRAWQNLVFNIKTQEMGLKASYAKTGYLIEYAPDWTPVTVYKLYNCYPENVTVAEGNQESDADMKKNTISLVYDYFEEVEYNNPLPTVANN